MTAIYIRSIYNEDQREFIEHFQIGKQIGKLLDMPKRPQAHKHILWRYSDRNKWPQVDLFEYMRNEAMLVLVFYFFFKNMLYLTFYGRVSFPFFSQKCDLREYAVVGCKVCGYF